MRLATFFLLNALAFNVFATEEPSDFEKGLRVLLELELNKFESCLEEGKHKNFVGNQPLTLLISLVLASAYRDRRAV